jgi:hypothetical protein
MIFFVALLSAAQQLIDLAVSFLDIPKRRVLQGCTFDYPGRGRQVRVQDFGSRRALSVR